MKKTRLLISFVLIRGRGIVKNFLALFRFTETDACTILSAYGFHGFEVDRLQNERANEQQETPEMREFQVYYSDEFRGPMQDKRRFNAPEGLQDSARGFNPWNHSPPATRPERAPGNRGIFRPLKPRRCSFVETRGDNDGDYTLLIRS